MFWEVVDQYSRVPMNANERTANRLFLAAKDMSDVKRYLSASEDLSRVQEGQGNSEFFDHCEAIMVAAIITYCRPFKRSQTDGNADPLIDLTSIDIFNGYPDLELLHKLLIERRDRAVAHADWEYHKTFVVVRDFKGGILRKSPLPDLTGGIAADLFLRLAEHVFQECMHRGFDLDRKGV